MTGTIASTGATALERESSHFMVLAFNREKLLPVWYEGVAAKGRNYKAS